MYVSESCEAICVQNPLRIKHMTVEITSLRQDVYLSYFLQRNLLW